jgi:hypothetical protein
MPEPTEPDDPRDDAVPTPVPPYEESPSSTGLVIESEDDDTT